jgi:hypothetical protein
MLDHSLITAGCGLRLPAHHEVRTDRLRKVACGRKRRQRRAEIALEAVPRVAPELARRVQRRAEVADELVDLPDRVDRELSLSVDLATKHSTEILLCAFFARGTRRFEG